MDRFERTKAVLPLVVGGISRAFKVDKENYSVTHFLSVNRRICARRFKDKAREYHEGHGDTPYVIKSVRIGGSIPFAGLAVAGALFGVFFGADGEVGVFDAVFTLLVQLFDKGDAPSAAGAGGEAFADEAGDRGLFALAVADDLALGDAEAQADIVVVVHWGIVSGIGYRVSGRPVDSEGCGGKRMKKLMAGYPDR